MSNFEDLVGPPDGWIYDVVRCEGHFVDSVPLPTDGYAEAVVVVDLVDVQRGEAPDEHDAVIDASEMQVLDHSPTDHGANPPVSVSFHTVSFHATKRCG